MRVDELLGLPGTGRILLLGSGTNLLVITPRSGYQIEGMSKLQVYDLPTRILAALSERRHRIRDGSQNYP